MEQTGEEEMNSLQQMTSFHLRKEEFQSQSFELLLDNVKIPTSRKLTNLILNQSKLQDHLQVLLLIQLSIEYRELKFPIGKIGLSKLLSPWEWAILSFFVG